MANVLDVTLFTLLLLHYGDRQFHFVFMLSLTRRRQGHFAMHLTPDPAHARAHTHPMPVKMHKPDAAQGDELYPQRVAHEERPRLCK